MKQPLYKIYRNLSWLAGILFFVLAGILLGLGYFESIRISNTLFLIPQDRWSLLGIRLRFLALTLFWIGLFFFLFSRIVRRALLQHAEKFLEQYYFFKEKKFGERLIQSVLDELISHDRIFNALLKKGEEFYEQEKGERERLETMLEKMSEGVLVINQRGDVQMMNRALREILGVMSETTGHHFLEVCRQNEIYSVVMNTHEEFEKEINLLKDNVDVYLLMRLSPWDSNEEHNEKNDKAESSRVVVFYDMTRLRRLESMRRDLVANVSHEFKTPLTSILGFSETLYEGNGIDETTSKKFLKKIYDNAFELKQMVDDMIELSKVESGQTPLNIENINWDLLVTTVFDSFDSPRFNQTIEKKFIKEGPISFNSDATLITLILNNLVSNALIYSEGTCVTVKVTAKSTELILEVIDDGIGLFPNDRERVFERFYRADQARSRHLGGTGLGLAIVKHAVLRLGGEIELQSERGHGCRFIIRLPI